MRRMVICAVMLVVVIYTGIFAYFKVEKVRDGVIERIDNLELILRGEDTGALIDGIDELTAFWEKEEDSLIHFIRHSHMDSVTVSVSRLSPLARRGEFSEIEAELAVIRRQLEHILESERVSYRSLF